MDGSHKQNVEWNKVDIKEDMRYNFISIKFKTGKTNLTIVVHTVLTLGWSNDWERAQRGTSFGASNDLFLGLETHCKSSLSFILMIYLLF